MNNNAAGGVGGGGWLRLLWPWLDIAFIRLKETKASGLAFEVYQLRAVPLQVSELQAHVSELEAWLKEEKHFEQTSRAQRINGRVQEIKPVRPKSNILALEVATAKAEDWVKQHTAVSLSLSSLQAGLELAREAALQAGLDGNYKQISRWLHCIMLLLNFHCADTEPFWLLFQCVILMQSVNVACTSP